MVNIDTRLLKIADANEVYWLLCIANRIGKDLTCFPSLSTQMEDTGWGKPKVISVRESCEKKGLISVKKRFDAVKNCQTSNVYKIKTPFLSVFVNLKDKGDTEGGSNEIIQGGSMKNLQKVVTKTYRGSNEIIQGGYENHTLSINQSNLLTNEVLEKEEKTKKVFSPSLTFENSKKSKTVKTIEEVVHVPTSKQEEKEEEMLQGVSVPETPITRAPSTISKRYETKEEMKKDLFDFWKNSEGHANAMKQDISKLGIVSKEKKAAFFNYVIEIFIPSILVNHDKPMTPRDIHKLIIQKIGFPETKEKLKALQPIVKETKIEKPTQPKKEVFTERDSKLILKYCNEIFKKDETSLDAYKNSSLDTEKRVFARAHSWIDTLRVQYATLQF